MSEKLRIYRIYQDGQATKEILEEKIKDLCGVCDSKDKRGVCENENVGPDGQAVCAATIKAGARWCGWATENGERPKNIIYNVKCSGFVPPLAESETQPKKSSFILSLISAASSKFKSWAARRISD